MQADEAAALRARAAAAEGETAELQRQLRAKAEELRGHAKAETERNGGAPLERRRAGGKGAAKVAALQSELAQKSDKIDEMEEQLRILKEMVSAPLTSTCLQSGQGAHHSRCAYRSRGRASPKLRSRPVIRIAGARTEGRDANAGNSERGAAAQGAHRSRGRGEAGEVAPHRKMMSRFVSSAGEVTIRWDVRMRTSKMGLRAIVVASSCGLCVLFASMRQMSMCADVQCRCCVSPHSGLASVCGVAAGCGVRGSEL